MLKTIKIIYLLPAILVILGDFGERDYLKAQGVIFIFASFLLFWEIFVLVASENPHLH